VRGTKAKKKSADALLANVKKEMAQPRELESVKTNQRAAAANPKKKRSS
jgi:hypothetical protein